MEEACVATKPGASAAGATESLSSVLLAGRTVGGLLGDSPEAEEALYAVGHSLYQQARYAEAQNAFAYLLVKNHLRPRNYIAFGACRQAQGFHAQALPYYAVAALLAPEDPTPVLLVAECRIATGDRAAARQSIDHAAALAARDGRHREHAARVRQLAALLELPAN